MPDEQLEQTAADIKTAVADENVRAVVSDIPAVIKETKEGYKTTEFWLTVLSLVAVNLNGVILTLPDKYQAIASAVIAGLYALSRGQAKKGVPHVETAVPEA